MSVYSDQIYCPVFVPCGDMTEVMISSTPMEDIRLSPSKDRLSFQIFPDPSDFERCCKLKDRLPSIVVEPTEGEVESGELRWPPEEFIVCEEEENHAVRGPPTTTSTTSQVVSLKFSYQLESLGWVIIGPLTASLMRRKDYGTMRVINLMSMSSPAPQTNQSAGKAHWLEDEQARLTSINSLRVWLATQSGATLISC
uniref:Protein LBH n=1 Tax=Oncorhynchus kisutch TaxID=8019 RepID=A0A8C7CVV4_ONCKI